MTVLRLKTWYALWGWKEWIQHVQGDSTVIVFDLGECIWKQKEWKNVKRRNCKLYDHFLNWTDLPCELNGFALSVISMEWWNAILIRRSLAFFEPWKFDRSSTRQDERWEINGNHGWDSCLEFRMLSEYSCVYCGRISMIQKGVPASRVGRFECNEGFRKIRFQNQDWSLDLPKGLIKWF